MPGQGGKSVGRAARPARDRTGARALGRVRRRLHLGVCARQVLVRLAARRRGHYLNFQSSDAQHLD